MPANNKKILSPELGMSLLELLVALAVILVLSSAVITPVTLDHTRALVTKERITKIYRAIMGDPHFTGGGYLCDMGRLPNSLNELIVQGVQPNYLTNYVGLAGRGWRGPYIDNTRESNTLKDGWGRPFDYSAVGAGQIRSLGPDGVVSSDDIIYPAQSIATNSVTTSFHFSIQVITGESIEYNPTDSSLALYGTQNGVEYTLPVLSGAPPYNVDLQRGLYALVATTQPTGRATPLTQTFTFFAEGSTGASTNYIEIKLANE
jgi:prepilin-type N-terminal cleavage/methylation domain-containing protein